MGRRDNQVEAGSQLEVQRTRLPWKSRYRVILIALASCILWFGFMGVFTYLTWRPGPWEPALEVQLPDGSDLILEFQWTGVSAGVSRMGRLTLIPRGGQQKHYPVRTGFKVTRDLELRIRDDNRVVFVVEYPPAEEPRLADGVDLVSGSTAWEPTKSAFARPLGRWLELGRQRFRDTEYLFSVVWQAPDAAKQVGTRLLRFRRRRRGVEHYNKLVLQSTDPTFRRGEWREQVGPPRGLWMVDREADGGPKVRAAFDLDNCLFYDEHSIVWRIPEGPQEPATKMSSTPRPYPKWATVTGGESITPSRGRSQDLPAILRYR